MEISEIQAPANPTALQTAMVLPALLKEPYPPYVQQFVWEFKEALNHTIFRRAWKEVLKRHDTFRQNFFLNDDGVVTIKLSKVSRSSFRFYNWSNLSRTQQNLDLKAFKTRDSKKGFAPETDPLCRFNLFQLSKQRFTLVWTSHHCLFDGRSRLILMREFLELYDALLKNKKAQLPSPHSFSEFQQWMQSKDLRPSQNYWKNLLNNFKESTPLPFVLEQNAISKNDHIRSKVSKTLSHSLTERLHRWSAGNKISVNVLIQTAWGIFLHKTSGNNTIVFGAPRACRNPSTTNAANTVGLFVNTVPVIIKVKETKTIKGLLKSVRQQWWAVREHENTPLSLIQQASGVAPSKPLFKSLVGYEKYQLEDIILAGSNKRYTFELEGYTTFPLVLQFYNGPQIEVIASYDRSQISESAIEQTTNCLETILSQLVSSKNKTVGEISLLGVKESRRAMRLSQGGQRSLPAQSVHQQFERLAEKHPKKSAVIFNETALSYKDLNQGANQLARFLIKQGAKPGDRIGFFLERDHSLLITIIAILKAGCVYVPFDSDYPEKRLKLLLSDSKPAIILASSSLRDRLQITKRTVIFIDRHNDSLRRFSKQNLRIKIPQDSPAYIMYTSGSTGKPKGVVVPHRGIVRLVIKPNYVSLNSKTRTLQLAPVTFDASTFEIWGALLNGGTTVLYPERVPDISELKSVLDSQKINTLWLTASLFNFIVDVEPKSLSTVSQLLVGGEALSKPHIIKAQKYLKKTQLINGYGPTENTTFSCCHRIPKVSEDPGSIPIGIPIQNSSAYVLNSSLQLMPDGVVGELYVGGLGVALGYLNRKKLTADYFIPNPFPNGSGQLLYRTGDKVYRKSTGEIVFLGRFDDQLKIRGHRIEPGEIQAQLLKHPQIKGAYVKAVVNHRKETELAAFLVPSIHGVIDSDSIKKWLSNRMQDYMVPSHFTFLDTLPLTASGKIDRRVLNIALSNNSESKLVALENLSATEKYLLSEWEKISGESQHDIHDSFFELGGHSLMVTSLLYQVENHFKVPVPFCDIRKNHTIYALADRIDLLTKKKRSIKADGKFRIQAFPIKPINPLSYGWRGKFYKFIVRPKSKGLVITRAFFIEGRLRIPILKQAIEHVINVHERLRTHVIDRDGAYLEKIQTRVKIDLPCIDISKAGGAKALIETKKIIENEGLTPMDFRKPPLIRTKLLQLDRDLHCFVFAIQHAVVDGVSLPILFKQISTTYSDLILGKPRTIGPPCYTFRQFEESMKLWMTPENETRLTEFWKQQTKNSYIYHLPFEKRKEPRNISESIMADFRFSSSWSERIEDFCGNHGMSKYVFLLTLGSVLISRYNGQLISQVTSSTNHRRNSDEMDMVGDMSGLIFLYEKLSKRGTFLDQAKILMTKAYRLLEHSQLDQQKIADLLPSAKEGSFPIIRQLSIAVIPDVGAALRLPDATVTHLRRDSKPTLYRLVLNFREAKGGLIFSIHYPPNLYLKYGIERFVYNFQLFIRLIIENPTIRLNEFPDLSCRTKAVLPLSTRESEQAIMSLMPEIPSFEENGERTTTIQKAKVAPSRSDNSQPTATQKYLISTWRKILGTPPADLDASFFDSGGNSLVAIQFIHKIRARFNLDISFSKFEKIDTIRALSEKIDSKANSHREISHDYLELTQTKVSRFNPLSYKWKLVYYDMITKPILPGHLVSRSYILSGKLNKTWLEKSINFVANLHERFRTKATRVGDEFYEEILPKVKIDLIVKDYSKSGEEKALSKAKNHFEKICDGGMNLQKLPLIEPQLIKLRTGKHFFIFSIHHSIMDGRSLVLLMKEISQAYADYSNGHTPRLAKENITYRQYYDANELWLAGESGKRMENFWKKESQDLYRYKFPFERSRYSDRTFRYARMETFVFKNEWREKIEKFCEYHRISNYVFILANALLMVYRYVGNPLVFASNSIDTRKRPEENNIVGHLGCIVFIKQRLKATGSFLDLTKGLTAKMYEVIENNNLGSPRLSRWIPNNKAPGYKVMSQLFVSKSPERGEIFDFPGIESYPVPRPARTSGAKMNIVLQELENELTLTLHHQPELFKKHGIERMWFNLQQFIRLSLESPELKLNQFPQLQDKKSICRPISRNEENRRILYPKNS